MARQRKWTRDQILLKVRTLHEAGEKLTIENMHRLGFGGMVGAAYKDPTLGSWKQAIRQAGLDPRHVCRRKRKWTAERVTAKIAALYEQNEDMSHRAARQNHQYLVVAAVEFFGSWEKAVTAAGLDYREIRRQQSWTRRKVIAAIRKLARAGEDLSYGHALDKFSSLTAAASNKRYFGSWGAAVEAAGLKYEDVRKHRPPWNKERIIAKIRELHAQGEDLVSTNVRRLGYRTMEYAARKPSNFGSWRNAVEAAGFDFDEVTRLSRRRRVLDAQGEKRQAVDETAARWERRRKAAG